MTPSHQAGLEKIIAVLAADARIVGVAASGSCASGGADEFSDLDLVIAVEPDHYAVVSAQRKLIAARMGKLLAAFTGEHVGEPRLLICLFDEPLMHVDLKFVSLPDAAARVDETRIVWQRDGRLTDTLAQGEARYPAPDPQWIEDRFWIWTHYCATKIGRGELFEALDFLAFLRWRALGPLMLMAVGAQPNGVRRIEQLAPADAVRLEATIALHERASCLAALEACVRLYDELRAPHLAAQPPGDAARAAALAYLAGIKSRPAE
jgi:predicted nucleotidyltransferase